MRLSQFYIYRGWYIQVQNRHGWWCCWFGGYITIVPLKPSPESSSLTYFDLETTGFQRTSDIVQIAAVCGEKSLNIHLKPNGRISEGASKVTGLTYENGILKRLGQPLVSVSADEGLKQFVMFLASSSKPFLIGVDITFKTLMFQFWYTIYKNIIL